MLCVIFAGKSTLLQYHVGKEYNSVFFAVVQNAGAFRGTVEQAEMILHSLFIFDCVISQPHGVYYEILANTSHRRSMGLDFV